ncbi:MAG: gamma-glutamylcyclotransferase family protein [Bdellovibrionota bacterium]
MASIQLFVVGSLCEGMIHHSLIQNFIVSRRLVAVPGKILKNKVGYPYLVNDPSFQVQGVIYEIEAPEFLWKLIDEHQGYQALNPDVGLSFKKSVTAVDGDGNQYEVWAYYINLEKMKEPLVETKGTCWMEELKTVPPLPEKLTDKQRSYIKKLGASSGRDIVPIDLTLYRELMSLELIVDKGRRLALSGLGKEVYKYIGVTV